MGTCSRFLPLIKGCVAGLFPLVALSTFAPALVAADPQRLVFSYKTDSGTNTFRHEEGKTWGEFDSKGKKVNRFVEQKNDRDRDVIVLYDEDRKCTVEIFGDAYRWRFDTDDKDKWSDKVPGHWEK